VNLLAIVVATAGPPTLLFVFAHSGIYSTCSPDWIFWLGLFLAWLVGVTALACGHGKRAYLIVAAIAYSLLCIPFLPMAALSASCSAGTCCL
jgi:hypothetical protein